MGLSLVPSACGTGGGGASGGDLLRGERRAGRGAVAEGAAAQFLPVVRGAPARQVRTSRDDAGRVEVLVHQVVVLLGLDEVDRVAEAGGLEQVAGVGPEG